MTDIRLIPQTINNTTLYNPNPETIHNKKLSEIIEYLPTLFTFILPVEEMAYSKSTASPSSANNN